MAVNRAINDYLDNAPDMEDAVIHYKPRSDFINFVFDVYLTANLFY